MSRYPPRCPPRIRPLAFSLSLVYKWYSCSYSIVNLFADDTMLFLSNNSLECLPRKINIDLKLLANWLNVNQISYNSTKSWAELSFLRSFFRPKRKSTDSDVKIKIQSHRISPSIKYLGVFIDNNLSTSLVSLNVLTGRSANVILCLELFYFLYIQARI